MDPGRRRRGARGRRHDHAHVASESLPPRLDARIDDPDVDDPASASASASPPVERISSVAPRLWAGLRNVGSGRFAVVVDDRLYVLDRATTEAEATLVPLPEGHVTIDDQSGSSLLATTFSETLVSTQPIATRTLSAGEIAIRSQAPPRWWLVDSNDTVRDDHNGHLAHAPGGLRVVGAVREGFVALDTKSGWVVWSNSRVTPIAPGDRRLLDTGPRTIAFTSDCGYGGCTLEILDLIRKTTVTTVLARIPDFAAFSPDGTRLALATTLGDVYILDPKTGALIVQTHGRDSPSPSRPFSWTPDSRSLLIVQNDDVEIRRATDGVATSIVTPTPGLEQLVALP